MTICYIARRTVELDLWDVCRVEDLVGHCELTECVISPHNRADHAMLMVAKLNEGLVAVREVAK